MKLFLKWIICVLILVAAYEMLPGAVTARGGLLTVVIVASILWLFNILIRPVAQVVALPLTIVTFGLFSIIVNALMVCLADAVIPQFHIGRFWVSLLIALCISAANMLVAAGHKER